MKRGPEKATAEALRRRRPVRQRPEHGAATRRDAEKLRLSRVLGNQAHGELIQARLEVGRQDDPLEREADRVADEVMRMPDPGVGGEEEEVSGRTGPTIQRMCTECEKELERPSSGEGQEEEQLRTKPGPGGVALRVSPPTAAKIRSLRGGGEPLSPSSLAFFQPRLGVDLNEVRVHSGVVASETARAVRARAFTFGRDIVFGAGEYRPESNAGRRLLAHELAHTLQQLHTARPAVQRFPEDGAMCRPAGNSALEGPMCRLPEPPRREPTMYESTPTGSRIESRLPVGETVEFKGVVLADDVDFVRQQLEELVRQSGREAARRFARSYAVSIAEWRKERERKEIAPLQQKLAPLQEELDQALAREKEYQEVEGQVSGGVPWSRSMFQEHEEKLASTQAAIAELETEIEAEFELPEIILSHLFAAARDIEEEIDLLLTRFGTTSRLMLSTVLDLSEQRIENQRIRYGIKRSRKFVESVGDRLEEIVTYSAEENVAAAGLMGAAADLVQAKQPLMRAQKKRTELSYQRDSLAQRTFNRQLGMVFETIRDPVAYESLRSEIAAKTKEIEFLRQEFEHVRSGIETRYPALAAFAEEGGTGSLEKVSAGAVADVVGPVIYQRLASIRRVRAGLRAGDVDPWKLPEIVTLTMADLGIPPNTMYARVIRDEIEQRSKTGVLDWILSGVALALGIIAAIPTGGSSLAVAASAAAALISVGVSGYMLAEHIQKYQLESSMTTTDFDRARSISQSEPSVFWLALDIVFFVTDLRAAAQTFRRMAPLAIRALGTGAEATEALQGVEQLATDVHGPEMAARLGRNLRALRQGGDDALKVMGAAGRHETEALAGAPYRGLSSRELREEALRNLADPKAEGNRELREKARELIREGLVEIESCALPGSARGRHLGNGKIQIDPNKIESGAGLVRTVSHEVKHYLQELEGLDTRIWKMLSELEAFTSGAKASGLPPPSLSDIVDAYSRKAYLRETYINKNKEYASVESIRALVDVLKEIDVNELLRVR